MRGQPLVEMTLVDTRPGKPPLTRLLFDVTLRNNLAEPRWYRLPKVIEFEPQSTRGGVDVVETYALGGQGHVVLGRFLGTGGFQAVRLPAGAEIRLRRLEIQFWEAEWPATPIPVEVIIAKGIRIGSEPAEAWIQGEALSDVRADVSNDRSRMLGTRRAPENRELAVSWTEARRVSLQVDLK